jgi:hypothetical protein
MINLLNIELNSTYVLLYMFSVNVGYLAFKII